MNAITHLWPEEIILSGDQVTYGAIIEVPGHPRRHLWYRLPSAYREAITKSCDPFILGMIFTFMKVSSGLIVHGECSPSLLRNLVEFQDAWACWRPEKYHPLEITADVEREQPRAGTDEAILGFSGGGDSTYTAWRHRTGHAGRLRRNLVAGVMLHGFDIPLEETKAFDQSAERGRRMLASIGMQLIPIATNFRDMGGTWEDAHMAGLASALTLLQSRYNTGLVASGYDYTSLHLPWGSNPITDPLLSSDSFQIILDSCFLDKMGKLEQIKVWPEAMKYLRVCTNGHQGGNCLRCAKCMKTIMLFRILRAGLPECFERDLSNHDIHRLRLENLSDVNSLAHLIDQARAASISASWVNALRWSIALNRLRLSIGKNDRARKALGRIYRLFLPGWNDKLSRTG